MRVYLAAPYAAREQVFAYAQDLCGIGFDVTSSWINEEHAISPGTIGSAPALDPADVARHAVTDLDDIDRCDVLVVFTGNFLEQFGYPNERLHTGGRHVETGYGLATGKPVVVVGEPENVFHRLGALVDYAGVVTVVPTWLEAVGALTTRQVIKP